LSIILPYPSGVTRFRRLAMNADTDRHPLYALVPDPAGLPSVCDAERFAEILTGMVAAQAPRVFAVVEEYGDRVGAQIAAWGMSFQNRTHVIDVAGGCTSACPHRRARCWASASAPASGPDWSGSTPTRTSTEAA
jgi:hypothetical protein